MFVIRILLFCLLVLVLVGIVRLIRGRQENRRLQYREGGAMVSCDYCALHVPEDQAVHAGEKWYCCEEHRRAADGDSG